MKPGDLVATAAPLLLRAKDAGTIPVFVHPTFLFVVEVKELPTDPLCYDILVSDGNVFGWALSILLDEFDQ